MTDDEIAAMVARNDHHRLLTTADVAEQLGVSPRVVKDWRSAGRGPVFVKVAHNVIRYTQSDVDAYVKALRQSPGESD